MGFHALTFARSLGKCLTKPWATDLVVIEGHMISQSHMDEMLRHVVLPILYENQRQYQALDDNARRHLTRISKMSFIITMLCALTGQCAHQPCLHLNMSMTFWTMGPMHNNGINNLPDSRCSVTGDTQHQITRIIQSMRSRC